MNLQEIRLLPSFSHREIIIGFGCAERAGYYAKKRGVRKVLLVTDQRVKGAGLMNLVKSSLESESVNTDVYDNVETEPTPEGLAPLIKQVRITKYDMLVGVGGGSVLDAAKVAAVMATNPGDKPQIYLGLNRVILSALPMILIPTTAGTGSEVSPAAVLVFKGIGKMAMISPKIFADVALIDPLMTITMPPPLTAATGIDALCHYIGGFMSVSSNLISDAIAVEGIRLIFRYLVKAYKDGKDIEARFHMALASATATLTFELPGLDHALGQVIGSMFGLPHGVSCGLVLPYVMEFNLKAVEQKLARLASIIDGDVSDLLQKEAPSKAIAAIRELEEEVGLPRNLKEIGVSKDKLPTVLKNVYESKTSLESLALMSTNPIPTTREAILELVDRLWEGKIL